MMLALFLVAIATMLRMPIGGFFTRTALGMTEGVAKGAGHGCHAICRIPLVRLAGLGLVAWGGAGAWWRVAGLGWESAAIAAGLATAWWWGVSATLHHLMPQVVEGPVERSGYAAAVGLPLVRVVVDTLPHLPWGPLGLGAAAVAAGVAGVFLRRALPCRVPGWGRRRGGPPASRSGG